MAKIKVISFDIGDTLYKTNGKNSVSHKLAEFFGIGYVKFKSEYQKIFDYTNKPLEAKIENLCKNFNKEDFVRQVSDIIEKTINEYGHEPVDYNIEKLLQNLKSDGYILICISKSSNLQAQIKGQKILEYFDHIFRTAEFELSKRDARLYAIIESKLEVNANEIIHIGDAYYDDYIFPQKYGMNAILYNNHKHNESCKSTMEIYEKIREIVKS